MCVKIGECDFGWLIGLEKCLINTVYSTIYIIISIRTWKRLSKKLYV